MAASTLPPPAPAHEAAGALASSSPAAEGTLAWTAERAAAAAQGTGAGGSAAESLVGPVPSQGVRGAEAGYLQAEGTQGSPYERIFTPQEVRSCSIKAASTCVYADPVRSSGTKPCC